MKKVLKKVDLASKKNKARLLGGILQTVCSCNGCECWSCSCPCCAICADSYAADQEKDMDTYATNGYGITVNNSYNLIG